MAEKSWLKYKAPFVFRNKHVNTIIPNLFRKVEEIEYKRERVFTPDDDFMDIDLSLIGSKTAILILHGLEGSSHSTYVLGMAHAANRHGMDAIAMNFRGCSGETNWQLKTYHSGKTEDLETIVQHIKKNYAYDNLFIVGFSLGGNVTLKYLGEEGSKAGSRVIAGAAISVPTNLVASSYHLKKWHNQIYLQRFLWSIKKKAINKLEDFPDAPFTLEDIKSIRHFEDLDNMYTAPVYGFKDAIDYWEKCSSRHFIPEIKVPAILINAADDPFLPEACYPHQEADANPDFELIIPEKGGHVGFTKDFRTGEYWHETRVMRFFEQHL